MRPQSVKKVKIKRRRKIQLTKTQLHTYAILKLKLKVRLLVLNTKSQSPQEDTASQTESLKEEQVSFQVELRASVTHSRPSESQIWSRK